MPIGDQPANAHTAAGYKKGIFSQDQTTNDRNTKNKFTTTNCICVTFYFLYLTTVELTSHFSTFLL